MGASTVGNVSQILKDIWDESDHTTLYKNAPLYGLIPKKQNFKGKNVHVPLRYSPEPGGSANFQRAQANKNPSKWGDFVVTRAKDYALGSISTELYLAARGGGEGAIVDAITALKNGLMNTAMRSLCISLYRNGGGVRGQVSAAGAAATTITLANVEDVVNFEVGMQLDGATTDGTSGAAIVGGAGSIISAIDRDLGVITTTGAVNWNSATAINGLAASNYLFRGGDFGATIVGLDGWIPGTAPTAGALFFGQDRSFDVERLAGCRTTAAIANVSTIEGALLALLKRVYRAGGSPDHVFLNPEDFLSLCFELGSKREYCEAQADGASFGYKGLVIHGQGGDAKVFPDPQCQKGVAWALQMDTWCFRTLGEPMSIIDEDGSMMLREAGDDNLELRIATYGNVTCDAPAYNGRCALPALSGKEPPHEEGMLQG